ncbi:MAG: RNA polymerase sigma factor [Acidimicrobiales bacterium]
MIALEPLEPPTTVASDSEVAADFAALFEAHYRRVVRALELGGLDHASAEDAAQEAFARTLAHWRRVREGSNPPGYVFRTAFRLARRQFRRLPELELDEARAAADDQFADVAARVDVEAALATMPPRRRACAVLCLVVGLSTGETARSLGIAEGTVRKQLEHARRALRAELSDDTADPADDQPAERVTKPDEDPVAP